MENKILNRQKLQRLTHNIKSKIQDLENAYYKTEEKYSSLLEEAAELVRLGRSLTPYVQKRALQLQNLISRAQRERGYSSSEFLVLHRQIDGISERIHDEFFPWPDEFEESGDIAGSRAGQPEIDQFEAERRPTIALKSPGDDSIYLNDGDLTIYRLGNMLFGVAGTVLKHKKSLLPAETVKYKNRSVKCFPARGDKSFFFQRNKPLGLLIVKRHSGSIIGLWCEKIVKSGTSKIEAGSGKMTKLIREHRFIKGRVKLGRNDVYIIAD